MFPINVYHVGKLIIFFNKIQIFNNDRVFLEKILSHYIVNKRFLTAKLSFLIANKTSIIYWVLLSIEASWRIFLIRSKIAFNARGATSDNFKPISLMNPTATSTESSVGFSNSSVRISKPIISWTTCWLTKWATNRHPFRQRSFWFLRNDLRKTRTRRERINSPIAGN